MDSTLLPCPILRTRSRTRSSSVCSYSPASSNKHISWKDRINKTIPYISISLNDTTNINSNQRLGIRLYSSSSINPTLSNHGDIQLLFLGRLFHSTREDHDINSIESHIIHIYKTYGIDYLLKSLQGVFSFVLIDQSCISNNSFVYVVTDTFGLIPIYYYQYEKNESIIINFTTKSNTIKAISDFNKDITIETIPQGSYCKLVYTNKVNSIWGFEETECVYNRYSKKWDIPIPKFRSIKYRILDGGGGGNQFPFSMILYEDNEKDEKCGIILDENKKSNDFSKNIKNIIKVLHERLIQYLINSFQKRIYDFQQLQIICIGSADDPEFKLIQKILEIVLSLDDSSFFQTNKIDGQIPKPQFTSIYIDELNNESLNYIQQCLQDEWGQGVNPTVVFMSSGLILGEEGCRNEATKLPSSSKQNTMDNISMITDYNARFYNLLNTMIDTHIIPNILEPLNSRGIQVEFPLLEESCISFYLSIFPKLRFNYPFFLNI